MTVAQLSPSHPLRVLGIKRATFGMHACRFIATATREPIHAR
jgi:hypothetical protein